MLIEPRPVDDSELLTLVVDQQIELLGDAPAVAIDPAARFLVAVVGGEAVGCGALAALDIDRAETKLMYVRPVYRGRGIARQVLRALEELAVSRGHTTLCLAAGVHVPDALALYTGAGYRPIARYGPHARDGYRRCFEKVLVPAEPAPDVRLLRRPADDPDVLEMLTEGMAELPESVDVTRYAVRPQARFVLASVDGVAAACGAYQPADGRTAEVRWLYVRAPYRRQGLARRILAAVEDYAAGAGYPIGCVDVDELKPEAAALFRACGYTAVAYGPGERYEKPLL